MSPAIPVPGDTEHDYLRKILVRLSAIENLLSLTPPQPPPQEEPMSDVTVTNFPAVQPVSVNNFPAVQGIAGVVSVDNFPAPVTAVSVDNFPAVQQVSVVGAATEATLAALLGRLSTNYGKVVSYFTLAQGGAGNTVIAAASPGNRHKVVGFLVTAQANATAQFLSAAVPVTGAMDILARGNLTMPVDPLSVKLQTLPGDALSLTSTGSACKGFVAFLTEP